MIDQGFRLVALCSRRVCGGSVGSVALAAAAGDLGVTSSGSSPVFAGFRFPREVISVACAVPNSHAASELVFL